MLQKGSAGPGFIAEVDDSTMDLGLGTCTGTIGAYTLDYIGFTMFWQVVRHRKLTSSEQVAG